MHVSVGPIRDRANSADVTQLAGGTASSRLEPPTSLGWIKPVIQLPAKRMETFYVL